MPLSWLPVWVALSAVLSLTVLLWAFRRRLARRPHQRAPRRRGTADQVARPPGWRPPKPPWVHHEVVRLKALMPEAGCRAIAATFNHLHGDRRRMTVGKSFVADTLRHREEEVLRRRRELKHRRPRPLRRNVIWGLDLTYVAATDGPPQPVFGLIDHGTRACLALRKLPTKSSVVLLRCLLDAVERFGIPRVLRTDNESVFTGRLFQLGLRWLGIRSQRTAPGAPWQNGRIERLFGTFKDRLRARRERCGQRGVEAADLALLRAWYNHVRPHQHLDGRTPAEAWSGHPSRGRARYVSGWDGVLCGFYRPTG